MADCSGERGAPLFRREFTVSSVIASATLEISGLGYYEAWINGRRVGDHVLDPAQTDYDQRVFYVSYDVTGFVLDGANAVGVMLGDGWYNQDRVWTEQCTPSYGAPRLLAELHIQFADSTNQVVCSDEHWLGSAGPITDANVYAGECYDARREQPGWCEPDFDESSWHPAVSMPAPDGRLERQEIPPIRKIEELCPVDVKMLDAGQYLVDMGQNFAGWARIRADGPAGAEISMRFAEAVGKDGKIDTASTGVFATALEQIDRYICKGEGLVAWEPRFTYHGFRYVEVSGWPGDLRAEDITGIVVHTDLPAAGSFECSDKRLNLLHRMALWTHRSNIHGIPEDCPARERCGWLGDANIVAEYSIWNFQGRAFWEKYLDDIETNRTRHAGLPCNIAPGKRTCGQALHDWAAAFIMLPWYVYVYYGDLSVLRKHWDGMRLQIEHFGECADNWILEGGYGDWYDPGGEKPCMHTPPALTTTIWFQQCAAVMARTAARLEKQPEADRFESWQAQVRDALIGRFYDRQTGSFGSQTANVMALHFGLVPDGEEDRVADSLVRDIRERDTHLNTGIMGVRFLFEVLTRHGCGELALALMHQDSYPSFGHLIQRGATTLWECWGEAMHDQTDGPRSLNHPMMGGFDNWFYNTLAGIQPDIEQPGFKHFFLKPHPIPGLDWVQAHHDCPHGRIVSNWQCADGRFEWEIVVPSGSTATVTLPNVHDVRTLASGTHRITDELK
ncbi:MAG: family 78 glycoside hydrolase catalytic domain [Lentisphaeria bacterium]|jgi:alpha-L-rhamnosidase|nr:family 78 glycoside hydrolase catalytic domain [Lentisphaeria bacterium]